MQIGFQGNCHQDVHNDERKNEPKTNLAHTLSLIGLLTLKTIRDSGKLTCDLRESFFLEAPYDLIRVTTGIIDVGSDPNRPVSI